MAEDYGIETEPDVESLVRRGDVDAIVISTPHHCHCHEALAAAAAGKHVLVEKPMATSLEDCDRMIAAFADRNLVLSVGYHQRFRESNFRTRDLIQSGAIGTVRCIQMSALFDVTTMREDDGFGGSWSWWTDPRSVAHLLNSAPHNLDLCRWWLGTELTSVAAHSGTFREENPNENT
ncbi:MAG: Gfo/Idh/MocA family oxidoreductase, partial [Planctomycetaceae bacterium]